MKKTILSIAIFLIFGSLTSQAQTLTVKKQIINYLIDKGELTQEEVKQQGGVNKVLDVQSIDLNKDGKPEFIVTCDCVDMLETFVFRKTADGVEEIYEGGSRSKITPLRTYSNGWRNLRYSIFGHQVGQVSYSTLRWDGSKYK